MKRLNQFSSFLFLILCLECQKGIAQKQGQSRIDSLEEVLKDAKDDSNKVKAINSLGWELSRFNPDTSIILTTKALQLSEKIRWQFGSAKSHQNLGVYFSNKGEYTAALEHYFKTLAELEELEKSGITPKPQVLLLKSKTTGNIGNVYDNKSDYPKALDCFFKAFEIALELGNKSVMESNLGNIGNVYTRQGDFIKALEYYFKALKMAEALKDKDGIASNLSNIGNVYFRQKDYPKTLDNYFSALKMEEELKDNYKIAITLGNIGIVYKEQGDYAKALDIYFKALDIVRESGNKLGIASNLVNIGIIYYEQKKYPRALDYYFKALEIDQEIEDKTGIAIQLGSIGWLYADVNNYQEAENYLQKAIELCGEVGDVNYEQPYQEKISEVYQKMRKYDKALEHYKKAMALKDSLFNQEKTQEITRKEMNYTFDKQQDSAKAVQDKKEAFANAEIGKQKVIRNSIAGGAGVLGLSAILSFFFYKRKRDAEQKQKETSLNLQVSETEMKALRSQMNPHFIFNALVSIRGFLKNHKPEDAEKYLEKFSYLMRFVVDNSQEREIPLEKDLEALKQYMELESVRKPFTYQFKIDESIDRESTTIPPLILQPFVENAIKHGLQPKDEPGHITIYIGMEEGALKCIVEDNGVGRDLSRKVESPMLIQKESMGMKLTEERLKILNELKKIKAQFRIVDLFTKENKPAGTRVELSLPLAAL